MAPFIEILLAVLDHIAQANTNLFLIEVGLSQFILDRISQKLNEIVLRFLVNCPKNNVEGNDGEVHPSRKIAHNSHTRVEPPVGSHVG